MSNPHRELEELLVALEKVENMMTAMQSRVAMLRQVTREVQASTAKEATVKRAKDKIALRQSAKRLLRFTETDRPSGVRHKKTLH